MANETSSVTKMKFKLLLVQLIAILPLLLFIFYLFDLWYDTRRAYALQHHINQARLMTTFISDNIKQASDISLYLSANSTFYDSIFRDRVQSSNYLKKVVAGSGDIASIVVTDRTGKLVASSLETKEELLLSDPSDNPYFTKLMESKKSLITDPYKDVVLNKRVIGALSPVIKNSEIVGVIWTSYNLEHLKVTLERSLLENNDRQSIILLIDRDKNTIFIPFKPLPDEGDKGLFTSLPSLNRSSSDAPVYIENEMLPSYNEPVIGASVRIPDLGWTIISTESINKSFAPLIQVQKAIWLVIVSAFLFSYALITYYLKKVRMMF